MTTIKDVARVANVSIATVSATFNNSAVVREETRKRVQDAAAQVGYTPNSIARSLRLARTNLIGAVVHSISNPYCAAVVRRIEKVAAEAGYSIIICNAQDEVRSIEVLAQLRKQRVDGIIMMPSSNSPRFIDLLGKPDLPPLVTIDQKLPDLKHDFVGIDNRAAARMLADYLLRLGHRRIACITGEAGLWTAEERLAGARQAIEDAGLEVDPSLFVRSTYHLRSGYSVAAELLNRVDRPTAIIGGNNVLALGTLRAVIDLGFRCPDDISIAGIDDVPWGDLVKPRIATVVQPVKEIGSKAIEWLLERLSDGGAETPPREQIFMPRFIAGESCTDVRQTE